MTDTALQSQDTLIAATFQQVLDEVGPRQAEVLRRGAIVHAFDAEVLAVLRERAEGGARVLAALAEYSFVRVAGPGRYAYQDAVRAALLREWREQRPDEYRAINARLADFFAARAAQPSAEPAPDLMAAIDRREEAELWRREALYHRLQADPAAGLAELRAEFEQAAASYRPGAAEALTQIAAEAPLDAEGQRWLRLMRARLAQVSLQLDSAASQLEALLAEPESAPLLMAEARQALADVLAETGQWARATELYRAALATYEAAGAPARAAEVMLRLGAAYRGLGVNTGGWYVPDMPQNPLLRTLGQAWYRLLALPFMLVAYFLRRTPWTLPRAHLLAPYENWLLARIFRTAQVWHLRARSAYAALGDELGQYLVEQQHAEILLLFGYAADALAQFDALRERPPARDAYRRLWIDTDRAATLIELGEPGRARQLLAELLPGFRALGDVRGEAAVLALQGRAAADAGDSAAALASYASGLARFRTLRYTAAREQTLYALRAWQRRCGPGELAGQIGALIDQEPEKRYIARFPRSLLPLLQGLVLGGVPITLLLASYVSPSQIVRQIGDSPLVEVGTFFDLWNVLLLSLGLGLLALGIYALVGLALIFFIRIEALEREQPDYLITSAEGIARYDYRGALALQLRWDAMRRWIRIERRLWRRPLALFSLAFLEDTDDCDLRIDGITGWYGGLQRDIGLRLRAAGNPAQAESCGIRLGPSKSGALLGLGGLLLLQCISTDNRWSDALIRMLPAPVYALIYLLAFSGLLMLIPFSYWFVRHPLAIHRSLRLHDRWPWVVGALGLAALLFELLGNWPLPVAALNIGVQLWGAYALAEAIYTIWLPRRPALGRALIVATLLLTALQAAVPTGRLYAATLSKTYSRQADYDAAQAIDVGAVAGAPAAGSDDPAALPLPLPEVNTASAWQRIGNALYMKGDYAGAVEAYTRALQELPPTLDSPAARQEAAIILLNRAQARLRLAAGQQGGRPAAQRDIEQACALAPQLCGAAR